MAHADWERAMLSIQRFLSARQREFRCDEIRNFLDSLYGRFIAEDTLKTPPYPLSRQLEERPARFLRHFAEIKRRTAQGEFPQ